MLPARGGEGGPTSDAPASLASIVVQCVHHTAVPRDPGLVQNLVSVILSLGRGFRRLMCMRVYPLLAFWGAIWREGSSHWIAAGTKPRSSNTDPCHVPDETGIALRLHRVAVVHLSCLLRLSVSVFWVLLISFSPISALVWPFIACLLLKYFFILYIRVEQK